jgi:hypothetical protein
MRHFLASLSQRIRGRVVVHVTDLLVRLLVKAEALKLLFAQMFAARRNVAPFVPFFLKRKSPGP